MGPVTDDERLLHAVQRWPREFAQEFKILRDFAKWVISNSAFEGCDLDGSDVEAEAIKCGLLVQMPYDRARHGVDGEVEEGDLVNEFAGPLKPITVPA